ncbi:hypothetical protein HPB51_008913 [Rhipicephalus microplus]|uniref:Uncharacterized protein n=1 Tax=Rhipicephalus microplus TaxID=6941 RepID=A0A9J6F004_RHIMP|nr:hypothetical protein HPB51_008913 [Rhipicephalus microplus]
MSHASRFCISQALVTLLLLPFSPTILTATDNPVPLPPLSQPSDDRNQEHGFFFAWPDMVRRDSCAAPSSVTSPVPVAYLNSCWHDYHFSGQAGSADIMSHASRFCISQVCKRFSLHAKRSDNRYLLLLPCPHVLCETFSERFSMILILLCSGDVETNPGRRNTRSQALIDLEDLPDDPTQHTDILFRLLKEVHAQQMESAKNHAELIADIKFIKTGQKSIETKVGAIQKRLDAVEEKMKTSDRMDEDIVHLESSVETLTSQQDTLQSRVDDVEDRSRRNIIILRGIPDDRETWEETEVHVREVLRDVLDPLPETAIERAHRLGQYHPGWRDMVLQFRFRFWNRLVGL